MHAINECPGNKDTQSVYFCTTKGIPKPPKQGCGITGIDQEGETKKDSSNIESPPTPPASNLKGSKDKKHKKEKEKKEDKEKSEYYQETIDITVQKEGIAVHDMSDKTGKKDQYGCS